ncbi:MAG: PspC domain-containing protein [Chitinophagales bacterium]|nr:PspC domain-containing protein [Chitinophagales bacterium]MDW8427091.1 PspC domain-containing protein [Chitinophagales bacterium]
MQQLKFFIEGKIFGVCAFLGERMGIPATVIRLYFIYLTCLTVLSPVLIYLMLAFWLNMKRYLHRRNPVWE